MTTRLDELRELFAKATTPPFDRPWSADERDGGWHIGPQPEGACTMFRNTGLPDTWPAQQARARLIAAAVNALPALLRCAESLLKTQDAMTNGHLERLVAEAIDSLDPLLAIECSACEAGVVSVVDDDGEEHEQKCDECGGTGWESSST